MADCPVTGLTYDERRHLEKAWKKMIGNTPREFKAAGISLVLWMFDNVPSMRGRFTKFSANNNRLALIADEMFLAHTQAVMLTLDSMIKSLETPQKLEEKIEAIVKSHTRKDPPIGSAYFKPFAEKFHMLMVSSMAIPKDHPEVLAWTKFLLALNAVVTAEQKKIESQNNYKSRGEGRSWCCLIS